MALVANPPSPEKPAAPDPSDYGDKAIRAQPADAIIAPIGDGNIAIRIHTNRTREREHGRCGTAAVAGISRPTVTSNRRNDALWVHFSDTVIR